jgi:hypothetical protein
LKPKTGGNRSVYAIAYPAIKIRNNKDGLSLAGLAPADAWSLPLGVMFFAYPVRTQQKDNFTLHREGKKHATAKLRQHAHTAER